MPLLYLFEPWKAPAEIQEKAGCIIGCDYPPPMVDHKQASKMCMSKMEKIKNKCRGSIIVPCSCLFSCVIALPLVREDCYDLPFSGEHILWFGRLCLFVDTKMPCRSGFSYLEEISLKVHGRHFLI